MTINVKDILSNSSKDLIYKELNKSGVHFILSKTEETDRLEIIFPLGTEAESHVLTGRTLERKDEKKWMLAQKVKAEILHLIHFSTEPLAINLSVHLSEKFHYDYTYLANLFSSLEGITVEKFVIINKINRVKELLISNTLTVTEIATLMHYSSISHLAAQFKKITGFTTRQFKQMNSGDRTNINP